VSLKPSLGGAARQKPKDLKHFRWWRRGELNRPRNSDSLTGKVLDPPAKSGASGDLPEHFGRPKMAQKDPNNPEKPDRVRSAKKKPQER
jgi:hypothetical protein